MQRHYERLAAFPERFVVLGDAISSFNPVYGQGMSSAALQVKALAQLLGQRAAGSPAEALDKLGAAYFPRAAEVIAQPWLLAASSDFAYPQTTGERPPNMEDGAPTLRRSIRLSPRTSMSIACWSRSSSWRARYGI